VPTKTRDTPVRNPRHRNQWDIEGKLFAEDNWALVGRYFSLEGAEAGWARFEADLGKTFGDCMFWRFLRLMAPRQVEPIRGAAA